MARKKTRQRHGDLQIAIMQILWDRNEATLAEIRAILERDRPTAATTVATVLSRLEQAGSVCHRDGDRARIYAAKIPRVELQRSQAANLVDRLFGGRAVELVAHLVRESEIDDAELADLRKLLRKRESS
ncbi:MAG TPA: BlaI/MecI/CopY family transcriptional regulator [Vicinamibacterales bacterium]|nr:BlaI/MecI/CopY family transcriptional regulator [Vicinamibacterales bacterium]